MQEKTLYTQCYGQNLKYILVSGHITSRIELTKQIHILGRDYSKEIPPKFLYFNNDNDTYSLYVKDE